MELLYITTKEAHALLNANSVAKSKIGSIIAAKVGFFIIKPDNAEYRHVPTIPHSCRSGARLTGIALSTSKNVVLLFCDKCGATTTKSSFEYPFLFIKEGSDERGVKQPDSPKNKTAGCLD